MGKHRLKSLPAMLASLPPRLKPMPKVADSFYQCMAWRALAGQIKRERGGFCERCGSAHRVIADHIIERRDGGADLDRANIELLCQACHNRKTAAARARRASGGATGGRNR